MPRPAPRTPTGSGLMKADTPLRIRAELLIGLPDTSTPEFAAEARRQCLAAAASPYAEDDQAFIDSVSILDELE